MPFLRISDFTITILCDKDILVYYEEFELPYLFFR